MRSSGGFSSRQGLAYRSRCGRRGRGYYAIGSAVTVLGSVVLLGVGHAHVAAAEAGPSSTPVADAAAGGADSAIIRNQDVLDPVADKLRSYAAENDVKFSDLEIDPVNSHVTVFRQGATPTDSVLLDGYQKTAGTVVIQFAPGDLTSTEVDRLDSALVDVVTGSGLIRSTETASWGTDGPGGAFTVWYSDTSPQSRFRTALTSMSRMADPKFSSLVDSIAYSKTPGDLQPASRTADTSGFYGGSLITPSGCSTGFSVRSTQTSSAYQTTAWHCIPSNNHTVKTGAGAPLGTVLSEDGYTDTSYINIRAGATSAARVFDGGYPDGTKNKAVVGMSLPNAGDRLCLSGAKSYVRCNGQLGTGRTWTVPKPTGQTTTVHGSLISSFDGTWLIARGDSGGPVFRNTNGDTQALAYGTISTVNVQSGYCPSWMSAGSECGPWGYISLARDLASRHHVVFNW